MADFEHACHDKGIALYVLPPKSPELNGGGERANGAWRGLTPSQYLDRIRGAETSPFHMC